MTIKYLIDSVGRIERAPLAESECHKKDIEVKVPADMSSAQTARLLRRLADEVESEVIHKAWESDMARGDENISYFLSRDIVLTKCTIGLDLPLEETDSIFLSVPKTMSPRVIVHLLRRAAREIEHRAKSHVH